MTPAAALRVIGQVECLVCGWRGNRVIITYDGVTLDPEGLKYHRGQLDHHTDTCRGEA